MARRLKVLVVIGALAMVFGTAVTFAEVGWFLSIAITPTQTLYVHNDTPSPVQLVGCANSDVSLAPGETGEADPFLSHAHASCAVIDGNNYSRYLGCLDVSPAHEADSVIEASDMDGSITQKDCPPG